MKKRLKRDTSAASSKFTFTIGAYVRVSTEEQAAVVEGSLDNQKHRLKAFVDSKNVQEENWGEIVEYYVDDGYSAKDTNRPAYQRMLRDLKKGKIRMILVTELSRLSRSIPDFCDLLEDLEDYRGKFLSIKELFDTSTPAGEMMIYNMINLAQFERKQISERVSINAHARAIRGLNNGAPAILGYDKKEDNKATFVVNEREAQQVREIFNLFLEHRSLSKTIPYLEAKKIFPKARRSERHRLVESGRWTVESLSFVLRNMAYIGIKEVNKIHKYEEQHLLKPWQKYSITKATWPAIVDEKVFKEVQRILETNKSNERRRLIGEERKVFLLSSLLKCGECGRSLVGQSAHGKSSTHRYYVHTSKFGDNIECTMNRIRAEELESGVINHLSEILLRTGRFEKVSTAIRSLLLTNPAEIKRKKQELLKYINQVQKDIDQTFHLQNGLTKSTEGLKLVSERLESLGQKKKALLAEIENLKSQENNEESVESAISDLKERLEAYKRGWTKASIGLKKGLLSNILQAVAVVPDGLQITYLLTSEDGSVIQSSHEKNGSEDKPTVFSLESYRHEKQLKRASSLKENEEIGNLQVVGFGRPSRT